MNESKEEMARINKIASDMFAKVNGDEGMEKVCNLIKEKTGKSLFKWGMNYSKEFGKEAKDHQYNLYLIEALSK